ncbi:TlpA family protein disulfide reductase [Flavobacterium sp. SM2513]|uniref:TlpA family protein disulfide reductase n=1 Tax=Flavobacterium sp. SM2513 TaxID=3424766 RepID=UPI003D7FA50F
MKFAISLPLLLSLLVTSFWTSNGLAQTEKAEANQEIHVYDFEALEPLLYTESDKTYIVNFWAMWCAPCVKEMPYFQEYANNHPEVELLFVSMDFPKEIETKLKPFLKKKGITAKVVLLDDPDANRWIDEIDPNWSGALPFTIVFNNKKRSFHERSFESLEELEIEVHKTIN